MPWPDPQMSRHASLALSPPAKFMALRSLCGRIAGAMRPATIDCLRQLRVIVPRQPDPVNRPDTLAGSPDVAPRLLGAVAAGEVHGLEVTLREVGRIHARGDDRLPQVIAVDAGEIVEIDDVAGPPVD